MCIYILYSLIVRGIEKGFSFSFFKKVLRKPYQNRKQLIVFKPVIPREEKVEKYPKKCRPLFNHLDVLCNVTALLLKFGVLLPILGFEVSTKYGVGFVLVFRYKLRVNGLFLFENMMSYVVHFDGSLIYCHGVSLFGFSFSYEIVHGDNMVMPVLM